MKGVHDMSLEKIKWWGKAQKKIKDGVWYYPFLYEVDVFENRVIQGFNDPITFPIRKKVVKYEKSCTAYDDIKEGYEKCLEKTKTFLTHCKNLGAIVTTLTFDQFYSFWSINPYRWHCRDLFAYTEDENSKKMFVQFKTKTDLHTYIGWREEIRETYEKQALIEEHSKNTIALLKEVQRDINDTNDKAIEYYEQAVEYLGENENE